MSSAAEAGGDIAVDVLILGAGIQGLYLARSLQKSCSVCVLGDPAFRPETLDSLGYISAGYEGNDAIRMQASRRAAGYWRLWAASHDVDHDYATRYYVIPHGSEGDRPRLWSAASLSHHRVDRLPEIFDGGTLADGTPYVLDDDVVINPGVLLRRLRQEVASSCLEGSVLQFGLTLDHRIDHVQVQLPDRVVSIVPRFTVLAAGSANATLLARLARRMIDPATRKERQEGARSSESLEHVTVLCLRGADLPPVSGWFAGLQIVAHPADAGAKRVWLVVAEGVGRRPELGPEDLRFSPPGDPEAVRATIERLLAISPHLGHTDSLEWTAYVARRTLHPSAATPSSPLGRPLPAKLGSLGFDDLLALWPSHLGHAMVLGDVASERITNQLGDKGAPASGLHLEGIGGDPQPLLARWEHPDLRWRQWSPPGALSGRAAGA
jgi:hypothetical protein